MHKIAHASLNSSRGVIGCRISLTWQTTAFYLVWKSLKKLNSLHFDTPGLILDIISKYLYVFIFQIHSGVWNAKNRVIQIKLEGTMLVLVVALTTMRKDVKMYWNVLTVMVSTPSLPPVLFGFVRRESWGSGPSKRNLFLLPTTAIFLLNLQLWWKALVSLQTQTFVRSVNVSSSATTKKVVAKTDRWLRQLLLKQVLHQLSNQKWWKMPHPLLIEQTPLLREQMSPEQSRLPQEQL